MTVRLFSNDRTQLRAAFQQPPIRSVLRLDDDSFIHLHIKQAAAEIDFEIIALPIFRNEWFEMQGALFHAHSGKALNDSQPGTAHRSDVEPVIRIIVVVVQIEPSGARI